MAGDAGRDTHLLTEPPEGESGKRGEETVEDCEEERESSEEERSSDVLDRVRRLSLGERGAGGGIIMVVIVVVVVVACSGIDRGAVFPNPAARGKGTSRPLTSGDAVSSSEGVCSCGVP